MTNNTFCLTTMITNNILFNDNRYHLTDNTVLFKYAIQKKVSEYDQEIPKSHTADQPTAP